MTIILWILVASVAINLMMYLFAYLMQTDKVTDMSYSATFILIAFAAYFLSPIGKIDSVFLVLILMWALRLGGFLFYRILKMGHDDRFDEIRSKPMSFLGFWIMQGLTCGIVSFSFVMAMQQSVKEINGVFIAGIIIALAGWLIETIADHQKFTFKNQHPNEFIRHGLWKRLRHPNYAGELLFWWGIFIASLPYTSLFISILSPLWISLIIIRFSGIPVLDKKWKITYAGNVAWDEYYKKSYRILPFLY